MIIQCIRKWGHTCKKISDQFVRKVGHGNNLGDMACQGGELERSRSKVVDEEESRSRNVVSEGSHEQRLPAFRRF